MAKIKKLTKAEHLELELLQERIRLKKMEIDLDASKINELMLQARIKQLEAEKLVKSKQDVMTNKKSQLTTIDKEHKEFTDKLKNKYKIKGAFGINPDTGEIKEE